MFCFKVRLAFIGEGLAADILSAELFTMKHKLQGIRN